MPHVKGKFWCGTSNLRGFAISNRKQPNWPGTITKVWTFARSHHRHLNNHFSNTRQGVEMSFCPQVHFSSSSSLLLCWWLAAVGHHHLFLLTIWIADWSVLPHHIRPPAASPSQVPAAHPSPSSSGTDPNAAARLHFAPVGGTSRTATTSLCTCSSPWQIQEGRRDGGGMQCFDRWSHRRCGAVARPSADRSSTE